MRKPFQIAIDGFAGCGKSTLAKDLASSLNFLFIDTGALYRGITLYWLESGRSISEISDVLDEAPVLGFRNAGQELLLNDRNVSEAIRSEQVADRVSEIAAIPEVRSYLKRVQNRLTQENNVVMEGRDIGTVILPNADLKLFITASIDERVRRRFEQLQGQLSEASVKENLLARDQADIHREVAPLKQADDAVVIDTSSLTREEQLKCAVALFMPIQKRSELLGALNDH